MLSLALSASARTHTRGCSAMLLLQTDLYTRRGPCRHAALVHAMPCLFIHGPLSPRRASIVIEFMQRQLQIYDDANDNETGCVNATLFYFAR